MLPPYLNSYPPPCFFLPRVLREEMGRRSLAASSERLFSPQWRDVGLLRTRPQSPGVEARPAHARSLQGQGAFVHCVLTVQREACKQSKFVLSLKFMKRVYSHPPRRPSTLVTEVIDLPGCHTPGRVATNQVLSQQGKGLAPSLVPSTQLPLPVLLFTLWPQGCSGQSLTLLKALGVFPQGSSRPGPQPALWASWLSRLQPSGLSVPSTHWLLCTAFLPACGHVGMCPLSPSLWRGPGRWGA